MKTAVLGSGAWGIAMAMNLYEKGHSVCVWSYFKEEVDLINEKRQNERYLPQVKIPDDILFTSDISIIKNADIIIIAVPSHVLAFTLKLAKEYIKKGTIVVGLTKGLEDKTLFTPSQVVKRELGNVNYAVLSGPSHAEEVARKVPTLCVVASYDEFTARTVIEEFTTKNLKLYASSDVMGVEIGGAIKNVVAIGLGICDGLRLGDNTKAAVMTRSVTEMARLGVKMGARLSTFMGLSGIGDMIVTCTSVHSRNHRYGVLMGQGHSAKTAMDMVGQTVEGYHSTKSAYELAMRENVYMPIVNTVYKIIYENMDVSLAADELLKTRLNANEADEFWGRL